MPTRATRLGWRGEERVRSYLEKKGWRFIAGHFRTRSGEIDLIMKDGATTVFIEVKTRRSRSFGYPEESLTERKLERLGLAAEEYLRRNRAATPVRLDLVILERIQGTWSIRHIRNIG